MEPTVVITSAAFVVVTLVSSLLLLAAPTLSWSASFARVGGTFGIVLIGGTLWALSTFWNSAEGKFYIIPALLWLGIGCLAAGGGVGALIVLVTKALIQSMRR